MSENDNLINDNTNLISNLKLENNMNRTKESEFSKLD